MAKIDVDAFITILEVQALRNDKILSEDEMNIINAVKYLGKEEAYDVYLAVLKTAYLDKKITDDEGDLMSLARDLLQVSLEEHQNALTKLDL